MSVIEPIFLGFVGGFFVMTVVNLYKYVLKVLNGR